CTTDLGYTGSRRGFFAIAARGPLGYW
nr:immunoglobulin heavy chain junction region [Macaca mulatta]MOW23941.1 immunoglobulin heavy chain junction region [Macaca mulatta]MOW24259.1 immunoglobulin heavy chain junction region [Macaca mulatta]MOW24335.1 immunoglobulin heavy chain junction region [Macaca mulatta]MOW24798.1 immunoglobulin heavy chain junction region [Macaca mulatta]